MLLAEGGDLDLVRPEDEADGAELLADGVDGIGAGRLAGAAGLARLVTGRPSSRSRRLPPTR
jgi:hypothetical protein